MSIRFVGHISAIADAVSVRSAAHEPRDVTKNACATIGRVRERITEFALRINEAIPVLRELQQSTMELGIILLA